MVESCSMNILATSVIGFLHTRALQFWDSPAQHIFLLIWHFFITTSPYSFLHGSDPATNADTWLCTAYVIIFTAFPFVLQVYQIIQDRWRLILVKVLHNWTGLWGWCCSERCCSSFHISQSDVSWFRSELWRAPCPTTWCSACKNDMSNTCANRLVHIHVLKSFCCRVHSLVLYQTYLWLTFYETINHRWCCGWA